MTTTFGGSRIDVPDPFEADTPDRSETAAGQIDRTPMHTGRRLDRYGFRGFLGSGPLLASRSRDRYYVRGGTMGTKADTVGVSVRPAGFTPWTAVVSALAAAALIMSAVALTLAARARAGTRG
jgi:hypothetical protein